MASPTLVADALAELAKVLVSKYAAAFDTKDNDITFGEDIWRAGKAADGARP